MPLIFCSYHSALMFVLSPSARAYKIAFKKGNSDFLVSNPSPVLRCNVISQSDFSVIRMPPQR